MSVEPYSIARPRGVTVPIVYDSPHSGREYPDDFGAAATLAELRRSEDARVDELISEAPARGITLLAATVPRCFIDLNRAPTDVDPAMLVDPDDRWRPTEKAERGLGLIRALVVPGVPIYDRLLTTAEVVGRIERYQRPYLEALETIVRSLREGADRVLHVDWHSMKSVGNAMTPDGPGARRPDIVLGDLEGASAAGEVTAVVAELLRRQGFSVAINDPYRGGYIVRRIGAPAAGIHSVQIEINRRLYLDELRVEKTEGFGPLRDALTVFTDRLADAWSARPA